MQYLCIESLARMLHVLFSTDCRDKIHCPCSQGICNSVAVCHDLLVQY